MNYELQTTHYAPLDTNRMLDSGNFESKITGYG